MYYRLKRILTLLCFSILLFQQNSFSQINSSKELIEKMKSRYEGKWYNNLTFKQKTSFFQNDSLQKVEIWYEAMSIPKGLILKIGSMDSGNGFIFKKDSMIVFNEGKVVNKAHVIHDLLILGFNIYHESTEETIKKLKTSGFDLSYFKDVGSHYIIGSPETKQAWIEKERLLFTKIESLDNYKNKLITEFNKYQKTGKAWVAPEVLFYRNGKLYMKEEYYDIETPETLPVDLFNIDDFKLKSW